ncbi:hypothetical protein M3Y98_00881000 [Aphelenchoides besseyi]|nr:hypothetical protein M3Y98_00881000 [Aphelenchoides besseyi]
MTDLNAPLSEAERSELALNDFIRSLVYRSGKYAEESDFQNFEPQHQNPQWLHLEQLMRAVRLEREVCEEVDKLGEFLDLSSYIQIVQDYFRFYPLVNERKKVVIAIIHLMVFSRLYARRLRQRMQVAGANEAFAQRNLDHLIVYTVLAIQRLLQNGLHIHWNQFCEEAVGYEIMQPSSHFPLTTTIATVCVAAIGVGFLVYKTRSTT